MRLTVAAILAILLGGSSFAAAQTNTTPAPAGAPAATSTPATPAPATPKRHRRAAAPAEAATSATPATATGSTAAASGSADEATAKQKCGSDPVVWGNPNSKAFHTADSRYYGKTKKGSYMCMKDATAAGYHAAKTSPIRAKKPATSS